MKLRYSTKYTVQYYNTLTVRRLFLPMRGNSPDRASFGRCMSTSYSARYSARTGLGIEVRGKTGAAGALGNEGRCRTLLRLYSTSRVSCQSCAASRGLDVFFFFLLLNFPLCP